jgi:hypothetical protein
MLILFQKCGEIIFKDMVKILILFLVVVDSNDFIFLPLFFTSLFLFYSSLYLILVKNFTNICIFHNKCI